MTPGTLGRVPSVLVITHRQPHDDAMVDRRRPKLGNRLRVARAERGLSQEQLAHAVGVSRQTVSSVETGQYCPSTILALQLARVLDVGVDTLFWLEGGDR